ncbi:MAG: hypothetical protein F6K14_08290 [Symploca sp. SIO2C1]|nr:hypothetical protein [Symploca sp. SIO2C1]
MPRDAKGRFMTRTQAEAEKAAAKTSTVQTPVAEQPVVEQQGEQLTVGRDNQLGASAYALLDVPTTLPDVSPDALLQNPGLNKLTPKEAAQRSASLVRLKDNLEVAVLEQEVTKLGIKQATNQVEIATGVKKFELATLKLADVEDQVEFQQQANVLNKEIRGHRLTDLKARAKKWGVKAEKAGGYLGTIDADYTEVGS